MTTEEKAEAYDIALDKIEMLLGTGSKFSREELEYVFPELKESEDERIKKAIIDFFKQQNDNNTYSLVPKKDIIAWLEKQGNKNKV